MNEEICCITNEGKTAKNECENDFDFLPALYIVYKKLGQFCFCIFYSLTCVNKDTSAMLQVINIEQVNK